MNCGESRGIHTCACHDLPTVLLAHKTDIRMCSDSRSPAFVPTRLPTGVLCMDYLKYSQLSASDELFARAFLDDAALQEAMSAIACGSMRAARPGMKVFFDGCKFWLASQFHRYEAARRVGARYQEFWCEIQPGSKSDALRYASARTTSSARARYDPSISAG